MIIKPIKRSEYFKGISKDHHISLVFCWKIRQGLKKDVTVKRICQYVQYFWMQHLFPHFLDEELILFAPLDERPVQKAINEHKQIAIQIKNLATCLGDQMRNKLAKLADMVDEHVRYEERELFPYLEKKLSKEQMENISKQIQNRHASSLQDDYTDRFWNV